MFSHLLTGGWKKEFNSDLKYNYDLFYCPAKAMEARLIFMPGIPSSFVADASRVAPVVITSSIENGIYSWNDSVFF